MTRGARASLVGSFLIALVGAAATGLSPSSELAGWVLLPIVGLAAGVAAGQPSRAWLALTACLLADTGRTVATGDAGGPFWVLAWGARLAIVFVTFVVGTAIGLPPRGLARRWRRAALAVVVVASVGLLGYVGYAVARSGEYLVQGGEGDCRTPDIAFGWAYEAINYDRADDARLLARHPDPWHCYAGNLEANGPDQGERAGTEVVASDGIHVAGWYIPAANAAGPTGPTLVVVHGGKDNKSGMLKYAVPLHTEYNLVLLDLRNQGRSTGDVSSGGILEARDLRAMIDWLERTKHPSWLGLVGNSNGAATVLAEAVDDPRPQAIVLDSVHASVMTQLGNIIETEQNPRLPAWPSAWAVVTGASWRLGVDITAADPERTIARMGPRPVLLLHGLRDTVDRPADALERNVAAALAAGVNVEVHVCPTGAHGTVIDRCWQAWGSWATHFLAAARGLVPPPGAGVSAAPAGAEGTAPPAVAAVTWCPITLGDGGLAQPGLQPTAMPAGLAPGQPRAGDVLYGVSFPLNWSPRPPLYAIGAAGSRCGVDAGTGFVWWVEDAAGTVVFSYEEPWGDLPMLEQGCRYLEAARKAYMAALGAAVVPAGCRPAAGDVVRLIPAGPDGHELALVAAAAAVDGVPELRLYGYGSSGGGVQAFAARCRAEGQAAAGCRASLALVAAANGAGSAAAGEIAAQ